MKIILSISGGGIRGLIPAIILAEMEKQIGRPLSACCDLIAGTSTGGIIACLLTTPDSFDLPKYTAQNIVEIYKKFGKKVFCKNTFRSLRTLDGLLGTKYGCQPIEALFKEYFGPAKLSQTKASILIPTYQISDRPYPHFFKTHAARSPRQPIDDPYLWECARATSAANGYFPPYKFDDRHTFLDGGIFANNPAMCAYCEAKNMYDPLEQLVIISIGTGEDLIGYSYEKIADWGILEWAFPFFKQTSISSNETIDYMLRTLTANGDSYYHFQASLAEDNLKIDDASDENLLCLESAAMDVIQKNKETISQLVKLIKSQ